MKISLFTTGFAKYPIERAFEVAARCGYDGIDIAKILEPKLTTLCQDTAAIGRMAAEKLIDLIENPKTTLIDRFSVDGTLFKGASVKKIRGLKKQDPASHKL